MPADALRVPVGLSGCIPHFSPSLLLSETPGTQRPSFSCRLRVFFIPLLSGRETCFSYIRDTRPSNKCYLLSVHFMPSAVRRASPLPRPRRLCSGFCIAASSEEKAGDGLLVQLWACLAAACKLRGSESGGCPWNPGGLRDSLHRALSPGPGEGWDGMEPGDWLGPGEGCAVWGHCCVDSACLLETPAAVSFQRAHHPSFG